MNYYFRRMTLVAVCLAVMLVLVTPVISAEPSNSHQIPCVEKSKTYRIPFVDYGFGPRASVDITSLGINNASQILAATSHVETNGEGSGRVDKGRILGSDKGCDNLDIEINVTDSGTDYFQLVCDEGAPYIQSMTAVVRITYRTCAG